MGMIRVSDDVEKRLKEVADGRSMNSVIEKMLAYCSSPDGFCPAPQADSSYEPYLLEQINKRFDKIESMLDDTLVDRVATHSPQSFPETHIEWPVIQDLFYDFLDESSPEWFTGVYNQVRELNVDLDCYVKDNVLYTNDAYGKKQPLLRITPRVQEFLDTHIDTHNAS